MSLQSLEALHALEKALRQEFDAKLKQLETDRQEWKSNYEKLEREYQILQTTCDNQKSRIKDLETFQKSVETQVPQHTEVTNLEAHDLAERYKPTSKHQKVVNAIKLESPTASPLSSTSHDDKSRGVDEKYETLKRKYSNLDSLFKEAKRQNTLLKQELDGNKELWRRWYDWWTLQKQSLRVKSTSPIKSSGVTVEQKVPSPMKEDEPQDVSSGLRAATSSLLEVMDRSLDEEPRNVELERSVSEPPPTQSQESPSKTRHARFTKTDTPSKKRTVEILEVPESPAMVTRIIQPQTLRQNIENLKSVPRAKSAPIPSDSTTLTSKVKKKREYPSMKFFTEDGTDGMQALPASPTEEDTGMIAAMLGGSPQTPAISRQTSVVARVPKGRLQELTTTDSDSAVETDNEERPAKRLRGSGISSEPRVRRELLSPSLAQQNRGRGRYKTSVIERNPDDPPRIGDFEINPDFNYGVSHPFNEVVRGAARKSLPATSCYQCKRWYEITGEMEDGKECIHQISRHRQVWNPPSPPHGFWRSEFPTEEDQRLAREHAQERQAKLLQQIEEEASKSNGRWKRRETKKGY